LSGQAFECLAVRHTWGEERVFFHDDQGHLRSIPRAWTSLTPADAWLMVSAGRSLLRMADCLALVSWVRDVSDRVR
jgi:hypothetical protein